MQGPLLILAATVAPAAAAGLCNLAGNWTSLPCQAGSCVHIQFFQPVGESNFTLRTTPWNAKGIMTSGHVGPGATATWAMVGGDGPKPYAITASAHGGSGGGAPPCTFLSSNWYAVFCCICTIISVFCMSLC